MRGFGAQWLVAWVATLSLFGCANIGEPQSGQLATDALIADASSPRADAMTVMPDARPPLVDAARPDVDAAVIDAAPDAAIDAPVPDAAPPPCEGGDRRVTDPDTGNCYTLFFDATSWIAAQGACSLDGSHLATITSRGENNLVTELSSGLVDLWLGASDRETEDTFEWITGEPFAFDNFRDGEPNDGGENGEDCLIIEADNGGTWDDRDCPDSYPYICEREAD